ncbi:MAG: exodeoxyribonuclease III [Hyphomicrobiales bacterium]
MTFKIATWNINSVRLRINLVERFLQGVQPDVLCLQEIKCQDEQFPHEPIKALGYDHIHVRGQKAYHGVATISRLPFSDQVHRPFCGKDDARHTQSTIELPNGPVTIHNFYVPAGGDEPDPVVNEKFDHKLKFLQEMEGWFANGPNIGRSVLVGDLNIAPFENDVWSHKQLLKVVSHTPVEVEHLERVRQAGEWVDVMREHVPHDEKLYTWWSYRARDWSAADKGRRLDHIWLSPEIANSCRSVSVLRDVRGWEPKPSDHAPVVAMLNL